MCFINTPFQFSLIKALIRLIKDVPTVDAMKIDKESFERNANKLINSWKQEFSISVLEAPISEQNQERIKYNTNLLAEMVSFCLERDLKPVIVIPPVTRALSSKFPETF